MDGLQGKRQRARQDSSMYENRDGFSNNIGGNLKLDKAKELIDDLEADMGI